VTKGAQRWWVYRVRCHPSSSSVSFFLSHFFSVSLSLIGYKLVWTRSVAAGFGQHGMPPPASNDTNVSPELRRGRDEMYRRCELMTLTFDLGGHGTCRWCGSTSSIHTPTLKFSGFTVWKIRDILCVCISWPVTLTFWPWNWCAM